MKCPYCKKEMDLGFIQCRDGLHWTPKRQFVAALSALGKGSVSLENGAGGNTVFAHRCASCNKIIIDCEGE